MNKQPPNDTKGSFVQPDCAWETWPPPVELATVDQRRCIKCNACLLKSWHLADSEKKDNCMYYGMYSTAEDHPGNYRVVLADSCINNTGVVFPATFLFEYRASDMSFRVTYHGGVWTFTAGGNGVDRWVDVVLCYRSGSWFTIYEGGVEVPGDENNPPEPWAVGVNPYFKLQNCHLGICGDILNNGTKYEGCVYWFQDMSGGECPIDRPLPPQQ